jgi:hypothetical protein
MSFTDGSSIGRLRFAAACQDADTGQHSRVLSVLPTQLVIAGWTGRNTAAVEHHIEELALLGVARPSAVPLYYRNSASLLTQASALQTLGDNSSGEAEPLLFHAEGQWWLTVGSDHTDRTVEAYSVAVSKQMCPKPVATSAWCWRDVSAHQDALQLRSRILEQGRWVDYQRGDLSAIRPLTELLQQSPLGAEGAPGQFLSCGTLGALPNGSGQGVRAAEQMEIELYDPVLGRRIIHRYGVQTLPVVA